ncbi:beta strand repeat-containing protein, partial [Limnohabitans sp.]|uniref:beta strand repeat-containing protein n=1 Tax=Limnohabitans sp. TaxID=1907725 RepID=UPI00391BC41E
VTTTNTGTSGSGAGNITIADALSFNNTGTQAATLSLIADNGIIQNAALTGTGTQLVHISMTANGNFQGNTAASTSSQGVAINAGITTNGNITLTGTTLTGTNINGGVDGIGTGVYINRQTLDSGASDVTINGTATNGVGAVVLGNSTIRGRNITLDGTANTTASNSGHGVYLYRDATTTIAASNNLAITGTVSGAGTGHGARTNGGNVGSAILMTAGGTATLKGIQTGNANNTDSALYLSGFRVNATGDVTLQAEAASSNSLAIHMNREAGSLNAYDENGPSTTPGAVGHMQVRSSSGNVLIQSNQGAVLGQDLNGGMTISGRNVTMDNTGAGMTVNGVANANGGSIDTITGAITLGSGTSTYSTAIGNGWTGGTWVPLGVSLAGGGWALSSNANVTFTGNLTIGGSSSAVQGLVIPNAMTVTGNIHLASRTSAANTIGLNISQTMTTAGLIGLTGESTNASPGVGLNIGAAITTTGTGSTTTLTSTTGAVSGTGNITTAAGNTGAITVNAATAGTLSGVISGGGSLVKQGVGTTTLTGTNTYTGTTTISAGALQVGSGSTTGTLGVGNITNNASLVFNRNNNLTVANAISGTGALTQAGTGTTILSANNSYGGTTTVSAGTLQVGNADSTGTLGHGGGVTLSNGAHLNFVRNVSTSIDNPISGNGNVSTNITGTGTNLMLNSSIALSGATGSQTNNATLSTAGSITQSAGSITATNLFLTATSGSIGTSVNRINSHVSNLSLTSAGHQFVTQSNAVNLAAQATGAGNIDVKTTGGTLTVTAVNGVNGVSTTGAGTISLDGTSATGDGLVVAAGRAITTDTGNIALTGTSTGANGTGLNIGFNGSINTGGNVSLTGNTAANNRTAGTFAAVKNAGTVSGSNITLTALASNTTADVLGYYGANGTLVATQNLTANAESRGAGVGFYMFSGTTRSGTGMGITGTGNTGSGIVLDNGAQVRNTVTVGAASGNVVLTGSTNSTVNSSVGLYRAVIQNAGTDGGVQITSTQGDVLANYGQANTIT